MRPVVIIERLTPKEEADFLEFIFQDVADGKLSEQEAQQLIDREYELQEAEAA